MGKIYDALKERFPDYPNTKEVENFVLKITHEMNPLFIIMFGALPRNDYTFNSDVDALLVFEEPVSWNEIYSFGGGVVQPISKTREDFLDQLSKGNSFFIQIMEEGIVLYSKPDILEDFKNIAAESINQMKMSRVEKGWDDLNYLLDDDIELTSLPDATDYEDDLDDEDV